MFHRCVPNVDHWSRQLQGASIMVVPRDLACAATHVTLAH